LYLHTITGVIEPSVENAERCRVGWGRVRKVGVGSAIVDGQELMERNGELVLVPCARKVSTRCTGIELLRKLRAGDLVAIHWGIAVMKISGRQAKRLESVTKANIEIANGREA
jgi:hydrogenase maturation factor